MHAFISAINTNDFFLLIRELIKTSDFEDIIVRSVTLKLFFCDNDCSSVIQSYFTFLLPEGSTVQSNYSLQNDLIHSDFSLYLCFSISNFAIQSKTSLESNTDQISYLHNSYEDICTCINLSNMFLLSKLLF
jgi:hypothetical protein